MALRRRGMLPTTLVVFLSDNGGPIQRESCNGGLRGGKGTPYEGGVRVPAFIHWPACLQPAVVDVPVTMWDLQPTLTHAAGVEVVVDGSSRSSGSTPSTTGHAYMQKATIATAASANASANNASAATSAASELWWAVNRAVAAASAGRSWWNALSGTCEVLSVQGHTPCHTHASRLHRERVVVWVWDEVGDGGCDATRHRVYVCVGGQRLCVGCVWGGVACLGMQL